MISFHTLKMIDCYTVLVWWSWWRHQMETFSALLAICVGNSPVTGEFPAQRPVARGFDVFFHLRPNKRLSKQSWGWWFEMPSRTLWRQCNNALYQFFPDKPERLADFLVAYTTQQGAPQKGPFPDAKVCHRHQGYPRSSATITVTCHPGMTQTLARYVYVYLAGNSRTLCLCELEVYLSQGENVHSYTISCMQYQSIIYT